MSLPAARLRGADPAVPRAAALDRLAHDYLTLQQDATVGEEKIVIILKALLSQFSFQDWGLLPAHTEKV